MTRISVALTTYNGERFIAEQLDSLAAQTHAPHELVVCDDGSTDATLRIVEEFAQRAPFPVRLHRNETNLGYADNFLKAASLCEGDWIAFCDQDDVWLPGKLADCAKAIRGHADAVMVLQNAWLCDETLQNQGRLFPDAISPGFYGPRRQYGFWVWPGFVKTVRRDLMDLSELLPRPMNYHGDQPVQTHDKWTCMMANALGGVAVLPGPAALYRRHGKALTGAYAAKTLAGRVREASGVGADRYDFLAQAAGSCAGYLDELSGKLQRPGWAAALRASAADFRRLQAIQARRASLYQGRSAGVRLSRYLAIWAAGGYVGPRFMAMGLKSAAKDAAFTVMGRLRS